MKIPPGLLVAAPRSGGGKTTVTLGMLRSLSRRGICVSAAKCGPDYIDPAFHAAAIRPSHPTEGMAGAGRGFNLDSWAMPPALVAELAGRSATEGGLVVCEGAMGLFDGVPAELGRGGASADIAAATGWPVVLVVDVSGQAQSAAATVRGFSAHDPRIVIAGVILNRVASPRHRRLVAESIEVLGIPIFGCLPRAEDVRLPQRHLGLVQASETADLEAILDRLADFVDQHVDVGAVAAAAASGVSAAGVHQAAIPPPGQRVAIARDNAFSFLYPHLADGWRRVGAELEFFSPLADEAPPPRCDACWLPGGYPELHAGRLSSSTSFLDGLRRFASSKSVHGECGGYMVLGEALTDAAGAPHRMAGLLGVETSFAARKMNLGYREARLSRTGPFGAEGALLRGHEFHYATVTACGSDEPFALVRDAYGGAECPAGGRRGNVTGSFFHVIAKA